MPRTLTLALALALALTLTLTLALTLTLTQVLAADVLYDKDNARHIARLLPRLLAEGGRCLISDQTQWPWRADFSVACAAVGLVVDDATLPAPEDVRLLSITRAEDQEA